MRKLIILSILILCVNMVFAQGTVIDFTLEGTTIRPAKIVPEQITLPLIMNFSGTFKGKTIEFRNLKDQKGYSATFGNQIGTFQGGTTYRLKIEQDNQVLRIIGGKKSEDYSVLAEGFKINLKGFKKTGYTINKIQTTTENVINREGHVPGYLLADAIYINENLKPGTPNNSIAQVLKVYNIDANTVVNNPYLNEQISSNVFSGAQLDLAGEASNLLSTVGGLNVTTIADGFAKFIVKRTKQELSIAFFERFKKELDNNLDLQSVFPQTYRTLTAIDDEIYMFQAYIQTLREAFKKDISTLPTNLPSIVDNHKEFFDANPELKAELLTSFYIAQSFQDNLHPGVIIENYDETYWNECNPNYEAAFKTLKVISSSLRSSNDIERYWASNEEFNKLYTNKKLFKIYLGLLSQRAKENNITYSFKKSDGNIESITLSALIDMSFTNVAVNLPKYTTYIKNIAQKAERLDNKIKGLNDTNNDSLKFENYYGVVNSAIDLMRYSVKVEALPHFPEQINIKEKTTKYFDMVQSASDMVIDVNRKNYSSAVINATYIYNSLFNKNSIKIHLDKKYASQPGVDLVKLNKVENAKSSNTKNKLVKYGSFISLIAKAETSDEVEAAIESFALPSGSSRIKRETKFNVSVNAYCGLFVGIEHIKGVDSGNKFNSYGLTAPVGFSISKGLIFKGKKSRGGFSASLFLSIVDLGTVAAFRFTNDSTETVPEIQLQDILSPGAFVSIGIPKSPLSINAGYQIGPLLRKVNMDENTYGESYGRFSISLVVDIPVLNLYTTPK